MTSLRTNTLQTNVPNSDSSSLFARSVSRGASGRSNRAPSTFGPVKKFNPSNSSPSLVSVLGSSSKKPLNQDYSRQRTYYDKKASVDFLISRPKQSPMSSPKKRKTPTPRAADQGFTMEVVTPKRQMNLSSSNSVKVPPSPPTLTKCQFNTPVRSVKTTPCHSSDRFIPNRSSMRVDLCRATLLSTEKRRLEFIAKSGAEQSNSSISVDSTNTSSHTNNDSSSSLATEILTPIQVEYQARMRGALLSLPIDTVHGNEMISGSTTTTPENVGSRSESDSTNLAYANIPELQDENVGPGRMLSFRGSLVDDSFTSLSSNGSMSQNQNTTSGNLPHIVTPDPFSHDQLRVLDRSSNGGSLVGGHSYQSDCMSIANKATRRINAAPTRILDAPELVDDYYLNLISWGKDNILAVALGQCVYLWNAATGDINHLLTLTGSEDFVTSVKWAEKPGNTNYLAVGTHDGPVQLWDTEALRKVRSLGR